MLPIIPIISSFTIISIGVSIYKYKNRKYNHYHQIHNKQIDEWIFNNSRKSRRSYKSK